MNPSPIQRNQKVSSLELSRIEDAGLNASAPPQQRWIDGWLVRLSPGKAKRARCINPVAEGRLTLDARLAECAELYAAAGLPMFLRITPFSQPSAIDDALQQRGFLRLDETQVMVCTQWPAAQALPAGVAIEPLSHADFAEAVGQLRNSPPAQRFAHAERLAQSPVPYLGWVIRSNEDGALLACAQIATEGAVVGLYDVFTDPARRGHGLGLQLCSALLSQALSAGARLAYLQVDADNAPARALYRKMGFIDAYRYHYRCAEPAAH